ncbi:hypothetical protein HQ520_17665, partial [bacterium]|nr:hypothetical protein [bacterium]
EEALQEAHRGSRQVILARKNTRIDEFAVDQFFLAEEGEEIAPSREWPPDQAVLSACGAADYLVFTTQYSDMMEIMQRILRMTVLNDPLEAHHIFVEGCHLYADLFRPDRTRLGGPESVFVGARFQGGNAHFVVLFP